MLASGVVVVRDRADRMLCALLPSLSHSSARISTCLGSLQLCSSDTLRACLICTPFAVRAREWPIAERSIPADRLARRSISRLSIQLEPEQGSRRADPSSRAEVNSRRYECLELDCEPSNWRYCESRLRKDTVTRLQNHNFGLMWSTGLTRVQ